MLKQNSGVSMFVSMKQSLSILLVFTLGAVPLLPQSAPAGDHIVTAPDLYRAVRSASDLRRDNLAKIGTILTSEPAQKLMAAMQTNTAQVTQRLSVLSDAELASLAAKTDKIQHDVVAGEVGKKTVLKYVIVGAAAALIIALVATHKAT